LGRYQQTIARTARIRALRGLEIAGLCGVASDRVTAGDGRIRLLPMV
jgi:hypothetical protein